MELWTRRAALGGIGGAMALALAPAGAALTARPKQRAIPPFLADIEHRTFAFFWDCAHPATALMPDRWPSPSPCSIAAVGFALTAWPIGAERGWVTRAEAGARTLKVLRFFDAAPMGEAPSGVAGYRGLFYHFLDIETGLRFRDCELSTVDSAWLFMGMLFAANWFNADTPEEAEIRALAARITGRAEWDWVQAGSTGGMGLSMGWHPDQGFIARNWDGYIEGMAVYLLALGSPTHPVKDGAYEAWTAPYPKYWRGEGNTRHLAFAPAFGHQWGPMWIDYRGIQDATMRTAGFDYFENSRRAAYAQRAYAIANPSGWAGYGPDIWGFSPCDGPGVAIDHRGRKVDIAGYSARGPVGEPDGYDDGTLAPTAALGFLPFAPEIALPAAAALRRFGGGAAYGRYGFFDSFNPSLRGTSVTPEAGHIDPRAGWVDSDYLGIDQGLILGMIANYHNGGIWRAMRRDATLRRGLQRAGFTGGWLGRDG